MSELIFGPSRAAAAPVKWVGAKAAALARLSEWGLQVPDFFVVSSEAFALQLTANGLTWPPSEQACATGHVPDFVAADITAAYEQLCSAHANRHVSVRSSGADEDSEQDSFAGQFDSFLGVSGPVRVLEAVRKCWSSSLSARSAAYRSVRGLTLGSQPNFGVIVQTQIFSRKAGVLFTVHPMDPEAGYLEANFGTGESVVGSLVTPDGITISRSSGRVVETRIGTKRRMTMVTKDSEGSRLVEIQESMRRQPVLTTGEAEELFHLALNIEQRVGQPQDVEWAIDDEGIWILQARPITAARAGLD